MAGRSWTHNVDLAAIQRTLNSLPHGERSSYMQAQADRIQVSKTTLYRALKDHFGKKKESPKSSKVPKDLIKHIAEIKLTYSRNIALKNSSRTLSTKDAQKIAASEGRDDALDWSESAINKGLHREGYTTPQARQRVEAKYALQQVQVDFSRSKHFQVIEPIQDTDDWLLRVSAKELHYKDGAVKLRLWVAQMRDEYSRLRLIRYYPATSESGLLGVDFMRWCFNRAKDNHYMRHLPERLKTDQGAFAKSKEGRTAMKALGIEPKRAGVEQSQAQGKVERGFRTLWQSFESGLATRLVRQHGEKATIRLSTLREAVHAFTVQEHHKEHPLYRQKKRGKMYRESLRQRSQQVEDWPLLVEQDVLDLATRTWTRTADATRLIWVENVPFEVPDYAAGKKVRVHRTMNGDWMGEMINGYHKGKTFDLKPAQIGLLDEWETRPDRVPIQDLESDVDDHLAQLVPQEELDVDDHAQEVDAPSTRKEEADEPQPMTLLDARAHVGRELRKVGITEPADYIQELVDAGVLYDAMPRSEVEHVSTTLLQAESA